MTNEDIVPSEETLRSLVKDPELRLTAQQLIDRHKLPYRIVNGELKDKLPQAELWLERFRTQDPDCILMKENVMKMGKSDAPVLITGQSGTGKETIARSLIGERVGLTVTVNCAGLPEHLMESELFGHVKGSFTGATGSKQGLMKSANAGLLFMDEVGELPMQLQAKLLRAIQYKKIRPVGSNEEEDITCRFVFATNRDLDKMVEQNLFREDLYARISMLHIHIKPLAQRLADIELIIRSIKGGEKFLAACKEQGLKVEQMNLRFNVRSVEAAITRFNVLSKVIL